MSIDDIEIEEHRANVKLANGRYRTIREENERVARVLSTPLPDTPMERIRFYMRPTIFKAKYAHIMYTMEDNHPALYKMLTAIGFPKH